MRLTDTEVFYYTNCHSIKIDFYLTNVQSRQFKNKSPRYRN